MGGIGFVSRNSTGEVIGGLNRRSRSDGVEALEALTVFEGKRLAVKKGLKVVKIESDLRVVIKQIKGGISHWRIRALLQLGESTKCIEGNLAYNERMCELESQTIERSSRLHYIIF